MTVAGLLKHNNTTQFGVYFRFLACTGMHSRLKYKCPLVFLYIVADDSKMFSLKMPMHPALRNCLLQSIR